MWTRWAKITACRVLRYSALAAMGMGFEFSLLLHLKLAPKPSLISIDITSRMFLSKLPAETMRSAILMPHLCVITQLMLLCIVFLLCSPRLCSWSCEIFKFVALLKALQSVWCLEGEHVWERISLLEAAFFTLLESQRRASDFPMKMTVLGTMDSCQLELVRISDKQVLLKLGSE